MSGRSKDIIVGTDLIILQRATTVVILYGFTFGHMTTTQSAVTQSLACVLPLGRLRPSNTFRASIRARSSFDRIETQATLTGLTACWHSYMLCLLRNSLGLARGKVLQLPHTEAEGPCHCSDCIVISEHFSCKGRFGGALTVYDSSLQTSKPSMTLHQCQYTEQL